MSEHTDAGLLTGPRDLTGYRVLVAGATGYIGRQVVAELVARGATVVSLARPRSGIGGADDPATAARRLAGSTVRFVDVGDPRALERDGIRGERFDGAVCCLASRSGAAADAWRVDHDASLNLLRAAQGAGVDRFVLLSAICVQRPRLAFQHAKLAFEAALRNAGVDYAIVRPTAYFKSLAGQIPRLRQGRPYVMFGNGDGAACKPIGEADLAAFMADCLTDAGARNRILPVGGPGPAYTARARGELLFELLGREPRYRRVPVALFDGLIPVLDGVGRVWPRARGAAEFARIGRYYASESMLLWDPVAQAYDAAATPAYGDETLRAFYTRVIASGLAGQELGDQALF